MQNRPMQSLEQPGSMQGLIIGIRLRCPFAGAGKRSEVLEPLGRRPARAVLVRRPAAPAHPVFPPDPLQVIDLDRDQADDGEEDLGLVHGPSLPELRPDSKYAADGRMVTAARVLLSSQVPAQYQ